jgi:hypothetical protein
VVFGAIGAGLGVLICLSEGLPIFVTICGGLIGALIGGSLARLGNEAPPRAMKDYASRHRLGLSQNDMPPATPMLLQPFSRTNGFVFGAHPSGFEGRIGLFNFIRPHRMYLNVSMRMLTRFVWPEAKGVRMLVAATKLSASREVLAVLLCERRYGGRLLDSVEEVARGLRRVHLESVELDRQYEVFAHPRQEPSWIRRLFSPSFIVWMTEELTQELSFEIFDGWISVAVPLRGAELTEAEIERISELAAQVVSRVSHELAETELARPPAIS